MTRILFEHAKNERLQRVTDFRPTKCVFQVKFFENAKKHSLVRKRDRIVLDLLVQRYYVGVPERHVTVDQRVQRNAQ